MRFALSILLSICSLFGFAQKKEVWIDSKFKAGFLASHRAIMGHLPAQHAFAGELSYHIQTKGEDSWNYSHKYPSYGGTLFFGSVGNNELLGYYLGTYAYVQLPIIRKKFYTFSFKSGAGLGYGTKVYDAESNSLSMAISTHLNAQVVLGVESRFKFDDHAATMALDMTHFSNGASKVPNLGLNVPYVSMGYAYRIQESTFCDSCAIAGLGYKSWEIGLVGFGSFKEIFPVNGKKYAIAGLNMTARRYFNRRSGMEISLDVHTNQALMDYKPEISKTQWELVQMGVFTGYLVPFGRLHLIVGMGTYFKDRLKQDGLFYHRVGTRYIFDNGINMGVTLKSHWARADFIEYGVGYMFKR